MNVSSSGLIKHQERRIMRMLAVTLCNGKGGDIRTQVARVIQRHSHLQLTM